MSFCYNANYLLSLTVEIINEYIAKYPKLKKLLEPCLNEIKIIIDTKVTNFKGKIKIYNSIYSNKFVKEPTILSALTSWKYNRNEYYNNKVKNVIKDFFKSNIQYGGGFFSNLAAKIILKMAYKITSFFGTNLQKGLISLIEAEEKSNDDKSYIYLFNYIVFSGIDKNSKLKDYRFDRKTNYYDFIKSTYVNESISLEDCGFLLLFLTILLVNAIAEKDNFGKDVNKIFDIFLKKPNIMVLELKDRLEKDSAILCSIGNIKKIVNEEFVKNFYKVIMEKKGYYFRDNFLDKEYDTPVDPFKELAMLLNKTYDRPKDRFRNFISVLERSFESFKVHHPDLIVKIKNVSVLKPIPEELIQELIVSYFKRFDSVHHNKNGPFHYSLKAHNDLYNIFSIVNIPLNIKMKFEEYPSLERFCKKVDSDIIENIYSIYYRSMLIENMKNIYEKTFKNKIDINEILNMPVFEKMDQNILNDIRDTYIEIAKKGLETKTMINRKFVDENFSVEKLPLKFTEYSEKYPKFNKLYLEIYKNIRGGVIIRDIKHVDWILESSFKSFNYKYIRLYKPTIPGY